ncbi:MAG: hypothetical protein PHP64_04925, partial [Actinomycetota bacterium]|nr:hypothetical protein [Actinomycetota bacterium]
MKDCPRCGFLNPDRAEYCIKCRFLIGSPEEKPSKSDSASGPVPENEPEFHAFEKQHQKPEIIGPQPDIDDTFEGRSNFDVGGYGVGGTVNEGTYGPSPGDAYSIMQQSAPSPGEWAPSREKPQKKQEKPYHKERKMHKNLEAQLRALDKKAP